MATKKFKKGMKMKKTNLANITYVLTLLTLIGLLASCTSIEYKQTEISKDARLAEFESTQELKKFSSAQEILDFLKNSQLNTQYTGVFEGGFVRRGIEAPTMAETAESAPALKTAAGTATDYSQTNIQVAGVDEADFVKNDGKYIYTLTQDKLVIVDAFPAENSEIVSETKLDGRPKNMFVNEDRLAVFIEKDSEIPVFAQYDFIPRPRYTSVTHILVYDISDRSKPELVKDYNLNGYYVESRMIKDYVYFIIRDDIYYYTQAIDLPMIKQASTAIVKPDIYYFDNPELNYNFNTVASFNIFGEEDSLNAKTFMMGYSNAIYVSKDNIYITYQKNLPYRYYEAHNEERFYDVVLPLLPSESRNKIEEIREDNALNSYEKWDKISAVLEEMYNKMDEDEKNNFIRRSEEAIDEYELRLQEERAKTVVHKIRIDNGEIEYDKRGEVPGYLLNQFSMDENGDYFRVATTLELYGNKGPIMHNNVYVLNNNLNILGKLEGIAPDERIYSTRFIGDRLYMVTFKRIDPLFVIDLSDPQNPEILGELKIPGFSDYLHPYDENHIIGIGKETADNEWGGVSVKGVKLALFDVSNVENPKQIDQYQIGDPGTDSEALRDHKAFLFDKEKNLLVIPVSEVQGKGYYDSKYGYYRQKFWQGAYVFNIKEDGFALKGKITHSKVEERDYYNYYGENTVRRALFMDDVLYTISEANIKMNSLDNIEEEINEIKLPYTTVQYPYPVPYATKGAEGTVTIAVE